MKKITHWIIACLALCIGQHGHAVTFDQAMIYYTNAQFEQAYHAFESLAAIGNARAQFNIGVMFARGEHVKKDYAEAAAWLRLAEYTESSEATRKVLGIVEKKLTPEEHTVSATRFDALLDLYSPDAVAARYFPEAGLDSSDAYKAAKVILRKVPRYPRLSAKEMHSGVVDVQYAVAKDGTVRNITRLVSSHPKMLRSAVEAIRAWQYTPAMVNGRAVEEYGNRMRFTFHIEGSVLDDAKVVSIVEDAKSKAQTGGGRDKFHYAYTLKMLDAMGRNMEGFDQVSLDPAALWFKKAAQDGDPAAKFELGLDLSYGKQCKVDSKKSFYWLEQAANEGLAEAQMMLGVELLHGGRFQKDVAAGLAWLQRAAQANLTDAQLKLAWIYATHPEPELRSAKQAAAYLEAANIDDYLDELTVFETQAVVYAINKQDKASLKALKMAQKFRKKYDLNLGLTGQIAEAIEHNNLFIDTL